MIRIYTQLDRGDRWLQQYRGRPPILACILGFTATGLIPGISAAGATPEQRKYTAIADAEFLVNGVTPTPQYPLPPLVAGASPVLISRAVVEAFDLPVYLFNAGLPQPPAVPAIDLGGVPAKCLTSGDALPLETVNHLLEQGLKWGQTLATDAAGGYLIISECVVGGTTTALSILTGLGIAAAGKVNSSHPSCNHAQKWEVVQEGLRRWGDGEMGRWGDEEMGRGGEGEMKSPNPQSPVISHQSKSQNPPAGRSPIAKRASESRSVRVSAPPARRTAKSKTRPQDAVRGRQNLKSVDPFQLVAAVGDPMQIVAAGMAIAASRRCGVLLAGGTQMLAVYALARAFAFTQRDTSTAQPDPGIAAHSSLTWEPKQVVVGTTRWVAEDPTGDTVGLAREIGGVPLLATQLSFASSRYPQLRAYEQGYVKEGVGAGGCAIAASLYQGWDTAQVLQAIEVLVERYCQS
jgi:NaMN:DMB phosphoribosyltransferase